ncbi:hypothetical protein ACE6H2_019948 [Prunus campanulata]
MKPLFSDVWRRNGIFHAILLSKKEIELNPPLLGAALCYWDSTSNTFAFGPGPMTPTILDMAALFGFKPWGGNIDALGDYELSNRQVKVPMKASKAEILRLKTYSGFMMTFQGMSDREQEHMMFLLFWLNRFVFPNVDGSVSPEYMHLAEALHNESGLATGPFMLASLYRCLYQITVNPLDLAVCGPLWMVQLWLEWYFPELGTEDLVYLEDDVPAVALALAPKRLVSTEECFIFFRECRKRPSEIWFRSLGCDLPWFTDGGLHQAPSQWRELTNFRSQKRSRTNLPCQRTLVRSRSVLPL